MIQFNKQEQILTVEDRTKKVLSILKQLPNPEDRSYVIEFIENLARKHREANVNIKNYAKYDSMKHIANFENSFSDDIIRVITNEK